MKHNCAEHFKVDFAEDPDAIDITEKRIIIWGNCSECGRELGKRYVYDSTADRKTGEILEVK